MISGQSTGGAGGGSGSAAVAESKSLWNYSLSPGWTQQEVEVLKLALQKFGIGKWRKIEE